MKPIQEPITGKEQQGDLSSPYQALVQRSLLGGVFVIRYGDGIVDSPIVMRRYSTVVYGGGGWRF